MLKAIPAKTILSLMLGAVFTSAHAGDAPVSPGDELHKVPARQGWFFYMDPKKEEPKPEPEVEPEVERPTPKKEEKPVVVITMTKEEEAKRCLSKETWSPKCGFVEPGDDFEFQAKQRDLLLQQMSLRPDNPDAVEAAQRYMKWVVGKASQAANMWYFNMYQNPDLDPRVKNPISEVGLALASRVEKASQIEYFNLIREEGGVLFYISRSDCSYCHDQAPYTRRVARTMGLRLINIPLDGKCLPGFEGDACGDMVKPEQVAPLQVQTVPTLFLYVPSATWIRLSTGLSSDSTIIANTVNFFSAYRAAMLQGLDNSKGARPSVSFDPKFNEKATGVTPVDGSQAPNQPDRQKLLDLMGYGNKTKPKQ